jgi:hypothetical protein
MRLFVGIFTSIILVLSSACTKEEDNTLYCFDCVTKMVIKDYISNYESESFTVKSYCNITKKEAKEHEKKGSLSWTTGRNPVRTYTKTTTECKVQ